MPVADASYATLSAMITPAIFLTANGSLIISTSNRMSRVVDRIRVLNDQGDRLCRGGTDLDFGRDRMDHVQDQLRRLLWRSDRIRFALVMLYLAFGSFVMTSLGLAIDVLFANRLVALPTGLAMLGVALMLGAVRQPGARGPQGARQQPARDPVLPGPAPAADRPRDRLQLHVRGQPAGTTDPTGTPGAVAARQRLDPTGRAGRCSSGKRRIRRDGRPVQGGSVDGTRRTRRSWKPEVARLETRDLPTVVSPLAFGGAGLKAQQARRRPSRRPCRTRTRPSSRRRRPAGRRARRPIRLISTRRP